MLAVRARLLRLGFGLTQEEVAQASGTIDRKMLSYAENGRYRPDLKELAGVARVLHWEGDPSQLIDQVQVNPMTDVSVEDKEDSHDGTA